MIGAYSLCYKEADWLGFNIMRMYEWFDEFSICVGPVKKLMGAEPDDDTVEALEALPDPGHKINIISGVWKDKNEMTYWATRELESDFIFQIDSDEVWPVEAFKEAVELLRDGARKVLVHMYTFWKNLETILTIPDVLAWATHRLGVPRHLIRNAMMNRPRAHGALRASLGKPGKGPSGLGGQERIAVLAILFEGLEPHLDRWMDTRRDPDERAQEAARCAQGEFQTPYLLDMRRIFRPCQHTHIRHIPPDLVWPNGEPAHWHKDAVLNRPIWHFSYIGASRVKRKFEFFNNRSGRKVMPDPKQFDEWGDTQLWDHVFMTGQFRRFARYDGPEIPAGVRTFVEGQMT